MDEVFAHGDKFPLATFIILVGEEIESTVHLSLSSLSCDL